MMKIYNYFKNGEKVNIYKYKHSRFSNIVYIIPALFLMFGYFLENIIYYLMALITYLLFKLVSISVSNINKTEHNMFTSIVVDNDKKEMYKVGIFPEIKKAIPNEIDFKNNNYNKYVSSLKQNEFRLQEQIGDCFLRLQDINFFKHIISEKPVNENYIVLKIGKIYNIKENTDDHITIICDIYNIITKNAFIKAPITINKTYENFNEIEEFIKQNNLGEDTSNVRYYEESYNYNFFTNPQNKYLLYQLLKPFIIFLIFFIIIKCII